MATGSVRITRVLLALVPLFLALVSAGCGQVVTRPTIVAPTATSTPTPTLSPTPRPTATPAPYTPAPTATPTVTPTPIVHTIARGETLLAVASRYGVSLQAIQEVNGIEDPRRLSVGQQIFIPAPTVVVSVSDATPTPAMTPLPADVGPLHFGADAAGGLWALGEVRNPGSVPLEGVKAAVTLLDEQGQALASGEALVQVDVLEPGAKGPFAVHFPAPPANFANYLAQITGAFPAHVESAYLDLEAGNILGEGERNRAYVLSGVIRNTGPEDAVGVLVSATLYDALGNVIGLARDVPDHNVVPLGGETTFTLTLVPLGGPVASSAVTAQGRRASTPTATP